MANIEKLAQQKGVKAPQLALAWVLTQGRDIMPIPGTTRRNHLDENLATLEIALTPAELAQIEAVAPKGAAAGPRYPEATMAQLNG